MIEGFEIDRILDLSIEEDRKKLREAAKSNSEMSALIEDCLDEFICLFPEPDWRKIYTTGGISVRIRPKHSVGFDLLQVLRLTKLLRNLSKYSGYEKLISGFRNPTQIESTYFEAIVANWCSEREVSISLEFAPEVTVKGKAKYPEFLWNTKLGSIYCECKRSDFLESSFRSRIAKLQSSLNAIYDEYNPWDPSLRLDVRFEGGTTNKIQTRFRSVVGQASAAFRAGAYKDEIFKENDVSAVLRLRDDPLPQESNSLVSGTGEVGTVAKRLPEIIYITLTMSLEKYHQDAVGRLLRDAKTQLPTDCSNAVFIKLDRSLTTQQKLLSLLDQPFYEHISWVSIWDGGEIVCAVSRNDQPFDNRLLSAKA